MANIPVERTGGTPWWVWLLALLALIALIWLLVSLLGDDDDEIAEVDPIEEPFDEEPLVDEPVGPITSIAMLADGAALVGREVDLDDVRVLTLTGDSSFFVGPGPDAETGALIVLQGLNESESLPPPPTGRDGEYNVDEGDLVDIEGSVAAFDATVPDYADMPSADRDRAMREGIYINADDVSIDEEAGEDL